MLLNQPAIGLPGFLRNDFLKKFAIVSGIRPVVITR